MNVQKKTENEDMMQTESSDSVVVIVKQFCFLFYRQFVL